METIVNGMQSLTTNIKYSKMTAKQYFHFIMSKEREDLNQLADILAACVSKDVLSTDIIMNVGFYFFLYIGVFYMIIFVIYLDFLDPKVVAGRVL